MFSALCLLAIYLITSNVSVAQVHTAYEQINSIESYWETYLNRALGYAAIGYSYAIYRHGEPVAVGRRAFFRRPYCNRLPR